MPRFHLICVVLGALLLRPAGANPWYSPIPITAGATIHAATQGGGQAVLVGGAGLIATSTNRREWTRRTSGTSVNLYGVAFGSDRFVAVGERGTILSSADGATWTPEPHPYLGTLAPDINGIIFANGRFVAVSRSMGSTLSENIITSVDGRLWVRQTVDRGGYQLQFVAFADGLYVAGGGGVLMTSFDAATWRTVWTGPNWLHAAVRGHTRWAVAGGDGTLLTSADGNTWGTATMAQRPTLHALAYRNGRYVAAGINAFTTAGNSASVFSSTDGLTWTALPFPESAPITRRDTFLALLSTDTGLLGFGTGGLIAETADGASWNLLSPPTGRPHFLDVVYGNGLFVAVGDKATNQDIPGINPGRIGAIYTSTDGWNWLERSSGVRGSILRGVAAGGGRFVAVGTGGAVIWSENGATWNRAGQTGFNPWASVAYGAGRFIVAGSGTITSRDGVSWESQPATAASTYAEVRFANPHFYLASSPFSGPVLRSADGVNWTSVSLAGSATLNDIAVHAGLGVAATGTGSVAYEGIDQVAYGALQFSTDGLQWSALRSPYFGNMRCVQHLSNRWVAASDGGAIFSSPDGRTWQLEQRPTNNSISRIATNADFAVAVGAHGTLLTTRDPRTVPAVVRPEILTAPLAQTVAAGRPLRLTVDVSGTAPITLQWFKDGTLIPGATGVVHSVANTDESHDGTYTVTATNMGGMVTSAAARVTILASRIVNLSIRSVLSAISPELTVGFFVTGTEKLLLVRAIGPTLTQFGLNPALARPSLGLYASQTLLASNEGWEQAFNAAQIVAAGVRVGAFPLPRTSEDSAVLWGFPGGGYSAVVRARGSPPAGAVLLEIYDADVSARHRLANVSALAPVGTGDNLLVAGFVLAGNTTRRLLIRAIGPGLRAFGRPAALADPRLAIIPTGTSSTIANNDNWGGGESLDANFRSVAAFPLAPDSKDAALVLSLSPGAYTVQVSGVGGTTGDALVELYELPD